MPWAAALELLASLLLLIIYVIGAGYKKRLVPAGIVRLLQGCINGAAASKIQS